MHEWEAQIRNKRVIFLHRALSAPRTSAHRPLTRPHRKCCTLRTTQSAAFLVRRQNSSVGPRERGTELGDSIFGAPAVRQSRGTDVEVQLIHAACKC